MFMVQVMQAVAMLGEQTKRPMWFVGVTVNQHDLTMRIMLNANSPRLIQSQSKVNTIIERLNEAGYVNDDINVFRVVPDTQ